MSNLKKKRREKFMKRVKQTGKLKNKERKISDDKKESLKDPAEIALRRIINEQKGRLGKKDIEEETR